QFTPLLANVSASQRIIPSRLSGEHTIRVFSSGKGIGIEPISKPPLISTIALVKDEGLISRCSIAKGSTTVNPGCPSRIKASLSSNLKVGYIESAHIPAFSIDVFPTIDEAAGKYKANSKQKLTKILKIITTKNIRETAKNQTKHAAKHYLRAFMYYKNKVYCYVSYLILRKFVYFIRESYVLLKIYLILDAR